jgi:hypothetical protein
MLLRLPRLDRPCDTVGISLFIWKAAAIASVVVTTVFSCLALIAIDNAKCVGVGWVAGHPVVTTEFWAPPLVTLIIATVYIIGAKRPEIRELVARYDIPWFELGSIRITFGMMIFFKMLIVGMAILGAGAGFSVARYAGILSYCW